MMLGSVMGPRFFRFWVGYGAILYGLLALSLAARAGVVWLLLTLALGGVWWWETATGFCRRCTHFNCGPHGLLMRRFFARDLSPLSSRRLRVHAAGDLILFAWPQWWIWEWPWLGAVTLMWVAVAAVAVIPFSGEARRDTSKFAGLPRMTDVR